MSLHLNWAICNALVQTGEIGMHQMLAANSL